MTDTPELETTDSDTPVQEVKSNYYVVATKALVEEPERNAVDSIEKAKAQLRESGLTSATILQEVATVEVSNIDFETHFAH